MNNDKKANRKPFTHNAYIFRNYGPPRKGTMQRPGWLQHYGWARTEPDGSLTVFLHGTPLAGFEGTIRCFDFDKPQPPEPDWILAGGEDGEDQLEPQRPGEEEGGQED